MLFVGRNDGFDARNNDNFFKILWSNLINFDKEDEIYQISVMNELQKEKKSITSIIWLDVEEARGRILGNGGYERAIGKLNYV